MPSKSNKSAYEFGSFFGLFLEKSANIRTRVCTTTYILLGPFECMAEISATWQHWKKMSKHELLISWSPPPLPLPPHSFSLLHLPLCPVTNERLVSRISRLSRLSLDAVGCLQNNSTKNLEFDLNVMIVKYCYSFLINYWCPIILSMSFIFCLMSNAFFNQMYEYGTQVSIKMSSDRVAVIFAHANSGIQC